MGSSMSIKLRYSDRLCKPDSSLTLHRTHHIFPRSFSGIPSTIVARSLSLETWSISLSYSISASHSSWPTSVIFCVFDKIRVLISSRDPVTPSSLKLTVLLLKALEPGVLLSNKLNRYLIDYLWLCLSYFSDISFSISSSDLKYSSICYP